MRKSILFPIIGLAGFAAVPAHAQSDTGAAAPEAKPAVTVSLTAAF